MEGIVQRPCFDINHYTVGAAVSITKESGPQTYGIIYHSELGKLTVTCVSENGLDTMIIFVQDVIHKKVKITKLT